MQLIGISAAIDAIISLIAYGILASRKRELIQEEPVTTRSANLFLKYLLFTFVFLALIAVSILVFDGRARMISFFVADLFLWISLSYMIIFACREEKVGLRKALLSIFFIFAALRSLYQLSGIFGVEIFVGEKLIYTLSNLDAWLMYAVWVPSAVVFLFTALTAQNAAVRLRSLFLAVGLLLIAFTWAFRLLAKEPSLAVVSTVSVIGFAIFLAGILYRKRLAAIA